ncbi:MAG: penicillin-binding protein activator [Pseudomonadota bacterium]
MFRVFPRVRWDFFIGVSAILLSGSILTACNSTGGGIRPGLSSGSGQIGALPEKVLTPNPSGEVLGNGNVRVALLVPSTIPGGAAAVAQELRNGAEMAIQDFGQNRIQVVVKDTKGLAAEAQTKASEALSEGSSLILGPLFAANVSAASGITLPANVSMLAFSTDTSVARRGVYLFSYTPQSDTRRMINYAASMGRQSIVAFLPRNAEGGLRGRILRETAGRNRINVKIHEYDRTPEGIEAVLIEGAVSVQTSDSIYIPEGGPIPGLLIGGLRRNGVDLPGKQLLGSGAWESIDFTNANLEGAIYPGRDVSKFAGFANRYQSRYGAAPGVQAALAYDAVTLASELVRQNGPSNAFRTRNFESNRGFQGTTGAFKIRSDGTTDRGLAIYKIGNGSSSLLEPAISSFTGRGT